MEDRRCPLVLAQEFPLDPQAVTIPLAEWIADNAHDEECMAALPRLLLGETVRIGGGAAPYCELSLIPAQPA